MFENTQSFNCGIYNPINFMQSQNEAYSTYKKYEQNFNEIRNRQILFQKQCDISSHLLTDNSITDFQKIEYIREMVDVGRWLLTETPLYLEGILISLSVCINATTGGIIFIKINDEWIEASSIFALQLAMSGHKKSLVARKLIKPFLDYEKEVTKEIQKISPDIIKEIQYRSKKNCLKNIEFSSASSIIAAINNAKNNEETINEIIGLDKKLILLSSFTDYGMTEFLEENLESALFLDPEGSELERFLLSQPLELILKCYGQEAFIKKTGRKKTRLENPALYMLVFAQLDIALKIYKKNKLNTRGFTSRLLPFLHLGNISLPPINARYAEIMKNVYINKIRLCLDIFQDMARDKKQIFISLSNDALDCLEKFRESCKQQVYGIEFYPEWLAKLPGQACRLALAAHIWLDPENAVNTPITLEEIKHGCDLASSCAFSAKYLLSPLGLQAQIDAKKIVDSLHRIESYGEREAFIRNGTTSTYLQQRTGLNRQAVNNALYHLKDRGFVALLDNGYGILQVAVNHNFFSMKFE